MEENQVTDLEMKKALIEMQHGLIEMGIWFLQQRIKTSPKKRQKKSDQIVRFKTLLIGNGAEQRIIVETKEEADEITSMVSDMEVTWPA